MTSVQNLDTAETTVTAQPLTARQRKFVLAFSVFTVLTVVALLLVTAQVDAAISAFSNSVAHTLLRK
jgi:hypothetical protein